MSIERVWLITGCSSGFGKELALAALGRGEKVIATARGNAQQRLQDLIKAGAEVLSLDVTSPMEELKAAADKAISFYGRVDVVVNNGGYVQQGAIEETSPDETFQQFNTNLFGLLNVCRAFLPHFRERRKGTFINIGSQGGFMGIPGVGLYNGTKYAAAGLTEALAAEVAHLGISCTCIEPGDFRTDVWAGTNTKTPLNTIPDYDESVGPFRQKFTADFNQPGDPRKGAERIVDLVMSTKWKKLPSRISLGDDAYANAKRVAENRLREIKDWREWSTGTNFPDA